MIITICGSMEFIEEMQFGERELKALGHEVFTPQKRESAIAGSNSMARGGEIKRKFGFIGKHLDKITRSDGIFVMNISKNGIENYIGANTFLEIGYAHYMNKGIYLLNPLPDQPYIIDELEAFAPQIIGRNYSRIG